MRACFVFTALAAIGSVSAQSTLSLCDKYTTALFGVDNEANQMALLKKVVNTVVAGNYTPTALNAVPGVLALPATFNGTSVNLIQYFNGHLQSTNRGGSCGVSVNFLDGGGAATLMENKAANCKSCKQLILMNRLYRFFAGLLGCSIYGNTDRAFNGANSMFAIHKYMALDAQEVGYFIEQVGLAATSLGVTQDDANAIMSLLTDNFGMRCLAPSSQPLSSKAPAKQSICSDCNCPLPASPKCGIYPDIIEPKLSGRKGCSKPKTCPA